MTLRPVSAGERIEVLDALRGAALFGIIAANMRGFSGPLAAYFDHTLMWTDPVNRVAQAFVDLFIQGKFITLFAFMFGIGFAIQMERADRSGIASRIFYVRRLAILFCSGRCTSCSSGGATSSRRTAARVRADVVPQTIAEGGAAVGRRLVCVSLLLGALMFGLHLAGVQIPAPPPTTPEELQRIIGVYAAGSYADIVQQNVKELPFMAFGLIFFYPRVLGVFLFGLWVWRAGIIRELPSKTELLRRCQKHSRGSGCCSTPSRLR